MTKQWIVTLSLTLAMVVVWILYSLYSIAVTPVQVNVSKTYLSSVSTDLNIKYVDLLKSQGSDILINNKSLGINYQ